MDIDKLLKSLDNEVNINIINLSNEEINNMKKIILNELNISEKLINTILNKLTEYKYIDELQEFKCGSYLRWINKKNNILLSRGGLYCETLMKNDGVYIVCKNYYNKYFQLKYDNYIFFQKLTEQEQIILKALEYIS